MWRCLALPVRKNENIGRMLFKKIILIINRKKEMCAIYSRLILKFIIINSIWIIPVVLLSLILFILYFCLPNPKTVMMIQAKTRSLEFVAVNPKAASINFSDPVCVRKGVRNEGIVQAGFLEPIPGSVIRYRLYGDYLVLCFSNENKVAARFDPRSGGAPIELTAASSILLATGCSNRDKPWPQPIRLPIWGPAALGQVVTQATDTRRDSDYGGILLSRSVQIFGRTISWHSQGESRSELYPAGEIVLPVASHLEGERTGSEHGAAWWGFALYCPGLAAGETVRHCPGSEMGDTAVLDVAASSEAERLVLNRMGSQHAREILEVGYFVQVFKDPFVLRIQLLIVGIIGVLQLAHTLKELLKRNDD